MPRSQSKPSCNIKEGGRWWQEVHSTTSSDHLLQSVACLSNACLKGTGPWSYREALVIEKMCSFFGCSKLRASQKYRHLVLLCSTLLYFGDTVCFIDWRFVANLHPVSLLVPFFQSTCSFSVSMVKCVACWQFSYFKFFIIITSVMMVYDQWSLISLL